jgi:hypothetical protein
MEVAFTALGLAFSPELLNRPDLAAMLEERGIRREQLTDATARDAR